MSDSNKKPAAKITLFPVTAAIWRNETEKGALYSVTYQCSFKNGDGKWGHSTNFGRTESLLLSKVADLAHSKICELESADRNTQPEDHAA
jgi:hypothetical protein